MGELGGFLKIHRVGPPTRDPRERVHDYREFQQNPPEAQLREQGARCMECGVPFCHSGCPLGNLIPDWNDLVYRDHWREAIEQLHATNNFPEFTGRLCPAPCEAACVLDINDDPVTIKSIENSIIDRAWDEGWVVARPPEVLTGWRVAVVGSGPAGMAAAQQLRREGHEVTLYERDESAGGLIRFGVPDFKIEKRVVERRVDQMRAEGVSFMLGVDVGRDVSVEELQRTHDAVVIAIGSRVPRDLGVPGRELDGVHFAMDYLYQRNRWVAAQQALAKTNGAAGAVAEAGAHAGASGDTELRAPDGTILGPAPGDAVAPPPEPERVITAEGKHVVVIGGGDTGADCVANAHREGAASVTQIELLGEPPKERPDDVTPWPQWPMKMRTSYALEEGGERHFSMSTARFSGDENGHVRGLEGSSVEGPPDFAPVPGTEFTLSADLVLLAMGFVSPEHEGLLEQLGVDRDRRGNVKAGAYATSVQGVFAAGDARRGQSLIVWAINEGRQCARVVNRYLEGIGADEDNAVNSGVPGEQAGADPGESEQLSGPPNRARFAGGPV